MNNHEINMMISKQSPFLDRSSEIIQTPITLDDWRRLLHGKTDIFNYNIGKGDGGYRQIWTNEAIARKGLSVNPDLDMIYNHVRYEVESYKIRSPSLLKEVQLKGFNGHKPYEEVSDRDIFVGNPLNLLGSNRCGLAINQLWFSLDYVLSLMALRLDTLARLEASAYYKGGLKQSIHGDALPIGTLKAKVTQDGWNANPELAQLVENSFDPLPFMPPIVEVHDLLYDKGVLSLDPSRNVSATLGKPTIIIADGIHRFIEQVLSLVVLSSIYASSNNELKASLQGVGLKPDLRQVIAVIVFPKGNTVLPRYYANSYVVESPKYLYNAYSLDHRVSKFLDLVNVILVSLGVDEKEAYDLPRWFITEHSSLFTNFIWWFQCMTPITNHYMPHGLDKKHYTIHGSNTDELNYKSLFRMYAKLDELKNVQQGRSF